MNDDEFSPPKRSWFEKFAGAFRGLAVGARRQSSFAVHLTFALLVVLAAIMFRVGRVEWCLLLLCITIVMTAEMFNRALEILAKAVDRRYNPHLADGLDVASAAVLLAAMGAAAIGMIIFLNRALALLT